MQSGNSNRFQKSKHTHVYRYPHSTYNRYIFLTPLQNAKNRTQIIPIFPKKHLIDFVKVTINSKAVDKTTNDFFLLDIKQYFPSLNDKKVFILC